MFSIRRRQLSSRVETSSKTRQAVRAGIEPLESRLMLAAQIYVTADQGTVIGQYDDQGNAINAQLLTGLTGNSYVYPAVSGQYLFISNFYAGTIGEYTTSGQTINANLVTGLSAGGVSSFGITVAGNQIFVANGDGGSPGTSGTVGEYTLGSTPGTIASSNPSLITGLADPDAIVVSGNNLFVSDYANANIGEYTTSGGLVNFNLVTGLEHPESLTSSGNDLFVTNYDSNSIGEYDMNGNAINTALVTGLQGPCGVAAAGNELFVVNASSSSVGEYSTSGATINASLITGLAGTLSITAVPLAGLSFDQEPTDAGTDAVISPPITVDVNDTSGDVDSTSSTDVTLSFASNTTGATLGGTTTVAAVNGVATFSDITVNTPGDYTLSATDPAADLATSDSFHIGPTSALIPAFGKVTLAGANVAGQKLNAKLAVNVTNTGSIFKGSYTVDLFADTSPTLDGNQIPLGSVVKKNVTIKPNKSQVANFNVKALPSDLPAGTFYFLAEVVDPNGGTNVVASTQTVQVTPPIITPTITDAEVLPADIELFKSGNAFVTIENDGNVTATGLTIQVEPSADGSAPIAAVPFASYHSSTVKILPGKSKTIRMHFIATGALGAGSFVSYVFATLGGVTTQTPGTAFTVVPPSDG
jgi:hypothetical protein